MFYNQINPVTRFRRQFKLKRIAKQVRAGHVPPGISREEIFEALRKTRPKGALEIFGILSAKQRRNGQLIKDLGVVGVKKVTLEFAKFMVDALCDSTVCVNVDDFNVHAMGDGSTAEASTDQALVSMKDEIAGGTQSVAGASSNVYQCIANITATDAYTVIEHGIFDTTGAADILLDRTVLATSFPVATSDEVEWTYQLTVNTET